jgi:hypothetical protein
MLNLQTIKRGECAIKNQPFGWLMFFVQAAEAREGERVSIFSAVIYRPLRGKYPRGLP